MTREEKIITVLKDYRKNKTIIESATIRIDMIDEQMHSIKSSAGSEPVKGGTGENKIDSLLDEKTKICHDYARACYWVKLIDTALSYLSADERKIISGFFFSGKRSFEACTDLSNKLCYDTRTIYRMRQKAIKKLCEVAEIY